MYGLNGLSPWNEVSPQHRRESALVKAGRAADARSVRRRSDGIDGSLHAACAIVGAVDGEWYTGTSTTASACERSAQDAAWGAGGGERGSVKKGTDTHYPSRGTRTHYFHTTFSTKQAHALWVKKQAYLSTAGPNKDRIGSLETQRTLSSQAPARLSPQDATIGRPMPGMCSHEGMRVLMWATGRPRACKTERCGRHIVRPTFRHRHLNFHYFI
jgi:hypothetical protein